MEGMHALRAAAQLDEMAKEEEMADTSLSKTSWQEENTEASEKA